MPDVSNSAIADALEELGDLYELDGAIVHRVRAYRRAARSVRKTDVSVAALARAGRATELPGIGATLQEKILALVQTGSIPAAERLREKFPDGPPGSPDVEHELLLEESKQLELPPGEQLHLIELSDVRGDLHCHTVASDGRATIAEMAHAASDRGYEYLAITDHSASHGFGDDVSPAELRRQLRRIAEYNESAPGIRVLAGSEVNILADGSLDYEDELLEQLDWVVASVHTAFGMARERMTRRVIAAIEHPLVDAIGHPTGRLIQRREPYDLDLEAVFAAAARTGTLLEINGNPDRRDLCETHARAAVAAGVRVVIDSDAHRPRTLENMRWGVLTARRAGLGAEDVANTRPWPELARLRKRARRGAIRQSP